jgi:hypothetical protein
MSRVISLKLSDEEDQLLREQAERRKLYPHGLVKVALRKELGLPVPRRLYAQPQPVGTTE